MSDAARFTRSHYVYDIDDEAVAVALQEPNPTVDVPEALVHDLWHHQRFDAQELTTTEDDTVRVLDPGQPNSDAGPDFLNAHVQIGPMDWRGHVEIHTTSGDWFEHEHNDDPRYDSVILHVSLHVDMWTGGLLRSDGSTIPEIILYPRLDAPLRELLHAFHTRDNENTMACAPRWGDVPKAKKEKWINQLARERMRNKRDRLADPADVPIEERLHERLFAGLGYAKNDAPMSTLARRLPPSLVRTVESPRDREALHLGVAGLLPKPTDLLDADRETADYAMNLRDRFRRLQVQYGIQEMEATAWTFFRLRPNNFPPLRIAQASAWYDEDALFSERPMDQLRVALDTDSPVDTLLETLESTPPPFWQTHYHLKKSASEHAARLGESRRETLIVNAVAPALLLDAARRDNPGQVHATIDVLQTLSPTPDRVVRHFEDLGTSVQTALKSQGLHQLYREYCKAGRCLECAIGQNLLSA